MGDNDGWVDSGRGCCQQQRVTIARTGTRYQGGGVPDLKEERIAEILEKPQSVLSLWYQFNRMLGLIEKPVPG